MVFQFFMAMFPRLNFQTSVPFIAQNGSELWNALIHHKLWHFWEKEKAYTFFFRLTHRDYSRYSTGCYIPPKVISFTVHHSIIHTVSHTETSAQIDSLAIITLSLKMHEWEQKTQIGIKEARIAQDRKKTCFSFQLLVPLCWKHIKPPA